MVVTTSTDSCVSARSGAENQTKVRQTTRPAPPIRISAASRWNLAWAAAPIAQAAPTSQSRAKSAVSGRPGRSPQLRPDTASEAATTTMQLRISMNICACSRRV